MDIKQFADLPIAVQAAARAEVAAGRIEPGDLLLLEGFDDRPTPTGQEVWLQVTAEGSLEIVAEPDRAELASLGPKVRVAVPEAS